MREITSLPSPKLKVRTPSKADRQIWALHRSGKSEDEIASLCRITPLKVRHALDRVQIFTQQNSQEVVVAKTNEMYIELLEDAKQKIRAAMDATILVDAPGGTGVQTEIPDHAMALRAIKTLSDLQVSATPRSPSLQINNLNQQQNNSLTVSGTGRSMEQAVRQIREKHNMRNEDVVIDAQAYVDDDDEDEDLNDIGLDPEENEDEVEIEDVEE